MTASPPKKHGVAILIGMGKPQPPGAPPKFKGHSTADNVQGKGGDPASAGLPEPDTDDQQRMGGKADPGEVGFHDGTEVCTACTFYEGGQNNCERWGFPVGDHPEGAYCHAFKAGASDEGAAEPTPTGAPVEDQGGGY
jgi:hypothetical protein